MAKNCLFEELDTSTREYLSIVRDSEGENTPGVFVPLTNNFSIWAWVLGLGIIAFTLMFTLTSWINLIYDDPTRLAMLQTAGLLIGGWFLYTAIRISFMTNPSTNAGHWMYVDPLNIYRARGESIEFEPCDDIDSIECTHNYNDNAYQSSDLRIVRSNGKKRKITIENLMGAEQITFYINSLNAITDNPETPKNLPLHILGARAKYIAESVSNGEEPDEEVPSEVYQNIVVAEIPEEPSKSQKAMPKLMPYIVLPIGALFTFFFLQLIINPVFRDNAIYSAVMQEPTEPRLLRAYLVDPRNSRHRPAVKSRLEKFYLPAQLWVRNNGDDVQSRRGLEELLEVMSTADQGVASLKVTESSPDSLADGKTKREEALQQGITDTVLGKFSTAFPPISPPPGVIFNPPPPAIGLQLISFVGMPEDAEDAHIHVKYTIKADGASHLVEGTIEFRKNVEDKTPAAKSNFRLSTPYNKAALQSAMIKDLTKKLTEGMIGQANVIVPGDFGEFGAE